MKKITAWLLALAFAAPLGAEEKGEKTEEVKAYPFTFCIISGEPLDPDAEPYAAIYEGQQYRFCCKDCWSEFRKDPIPTVKKFKKLIEKEKTAEASDSGE